MSRRFSRHMRSAVPAALSAAVVLIAAIVIAVVVAQRQQDARSEAFDREADAAVGEIEREIERHLDVIGDVTVFADATWPGELGEWRRYLEGRMTGGGYFAFTSSAGVVERVSFDQVDALVEREAALGSPINIREVVPLPGEEDRLILTRTTGDDVELRGLELSVVSGLLGLELPATEDRVLVAVIEDAPQVVLDTLGIRLEDFNDDAVVGSDVVFVQAVGSPGAEPLGWIIAPANLAYLLDRAVESIEGDLSIEIDATGADSRDALAQYTGAGSLTFEDAPLRRKQTLSIGDWDWTVEVWADEADAGPVGAARLVLFAGVVLAIVAGVLVELRRRHEQGLVEARIELSLQRTLAETDHLTGLLNRQALASARQSIRGPGAVFFADLDGFKAINDELGHAVGDDVLVSVARALRGAARKNDLAVRLGGDEFVLVCPGVVTAAVAEDREREIRRVIAAIDAPVPLRASVGSALAQVSVADELDELLVAADASMYDDKNSPRDAPDSVS